MITNIITIVQFKLLSNFNDEISEAYLIQIVFAVCKYSSNDLATVLEGVHGVQTEATT